MKPTESGSFRAKSRALRFPPIADTGEAADSSVMYRKDADLKIVRDVRQRLTDMRQEMPSADWRLAVFSSRAEHASWYRHHEPALLAGVEALLREAGVDMSEPDKRTSFIAKVAFDR